MITIADLHSNQLLFQALDKSHSLSICVELHEIVPTYAVLLRRAVQAVSKGAIIAKSYSLLTI